MIFFRGESKDHFDVSAFNGVFLCEMEVILDYGRADVGGSDAICFGREFWAI